MNVSRQNASPSASSGMIEPLTAITSRARRAAPKKTRTVRSWRTISRTNSKVWTPRSADSRMGPLWIEGHGVVAFAVLPGLNAIVVD